MNIFSSAEGLDWGLVEKIARNELRLSPWADAAGDLAEVKRAFANALLERHLDIWRDIPPEAGGVPTAAIKDTLSKMIGSEPFPGAADGLSDEFIAGHAIAVMATIDADRNLARIPMLSEVVDKDPEKRPLMAYLGEVGPDRMQGVDMTRPIQSRQSVTPQAVMDRAEDLDLWTRDDKLADGPCADVLTFADCEEIAQRLMDSFGDLDLDYGDLEEVDDRIVSRAQANLAALDTDEDEPHPPYSISRQRTQAEAPGRDQETGAPGWEPEH